MQTKKKRPASGIFFSAWFARDNDDTVTTGRACLCTSSSYACTLQYLRKVGT